MNGADTGSSAKDVPNLWQSILRETAARTADELETKYAVVLGNRGSGKSSLVARLQGMNLADCPPKGIALDYTFLDVEAADDSDELLTRIGLWSLEGDSDLSYLLRFCITTETLRKLLVVITVDFSEPWHVAKSLDGWFKLLASRLDELVGDIDEMGTLQGEKRCKDILEECKKAQVCRWQRYKEPDLLEAAEKSSRAHIPTHADAPKSAEDLGEADLPLPDGVLTDNLGLPVVVVCCKADAISDLEKQYNYRGDYFDYIQQHIRRVCLRYGATLLYSSAKRDTNTEVLFDVMKHDLYSFDLPHPPQLVERQLTFIPAGWDTQHKIDLDFANQSLCDDPADPFEEVIKQPAILKGAAAAARQRLAGSPMLSDSTGDLSLLTDMDVAAEDDQEFLLRHLKLTEKDRAAAKPSSTPRTPEEAMAQKAEGTPGDFVLDGQGEADSPVKKTPTHAGKSPYSTPKGKQPGFPPHSAPHLALGDPKTPAQAALSPKSMATPSDHKVLADFFNSLLSGTPQATPKKDGEK